MHTHAQTSCTHIVYVHTHHAHTIMHTHHTHTTRTHVHTHHAVGCSGWGPGGQIVGRRQWWLCASDGRRMNDLSSFSSTSQHAPQPGRYSCCRRRWHVVWLAMIFDSFLLIIWYSIITTRHVLFTQSSVIWLLSKLHVLRDNARCDWSNNSIGISSNLRD